MKKLTGLLTGVIICFGSRAQSNPASEDKAILKNLCGCFEVSFKYAETFSPDPNYKYHEREEINGGIELSLTH